MRAFTSRDLQFDDDWGLGGKKGQFARLWIALASETLMEYNLGKILFKNSELEPLKRTWHGRGRTLIATFEGIELKIIRK